MPSITTFEPAAISAEPPVEAAASSDVETATRTEAEALLGEAADAIAVKPAEPAEADQVEKAAPGLILAKIEPVPAGTVRKDSMLTPADLARVTFRTQERRLETWRAAMLFMTVVAVGLGSLIAAWRFVPEHLPPRLQPNTILGLPDLGPSERIPAQHGTQFEE
jgi:hypothetical protein